MKFLNFSAQEWAMRAGRSDLLDKKIGNLTKYYLCSDHFTNDDFLNPDVDDKSFLRLKKIPSAPIPSIFEDNLMKNVQSAVENADKFVTYSKSRTQQDSLISLDQKRSLNITEKILFGSPSAKKSRHEPEVEEIEYLNPEDQFELVENNICRLCANNCLDLIAIFDEDGNYYAETECFSIMPQGVITKDDGHPQFACTECLEKLQSCSNTIDNFLHNQSLFTTS